MFNQNSQKLASSALVKSRELQDLINLLNNTTVGSLQISITTNTNNISYLSSRITDEVATLNDSIAANTTSIASLQLLITTNTNNISSLSSQITDEVAILNDSIDANAIAMNQQIGIINAKIDAMAMLFGITFSESGIITTEAYSAHVHSYYDDTISDTNDGTGTTTTTTKTTQGVI